MKFKYLLALFFVASFIFVSCKKDDENDGEQKAADFDKTAMLSNVGNNIIIPGYLDFKNKAEELNIKVQNFNSNPGAESLTDLQNTFKETYKSWTRVSMFEFGPAEIERLKSHLNVYPTNADSINYRINTNSVSLDLYTVEGLPAIDYLLFGIGVDNESILNQYTTDQKAASRKAYLSALTEKIRTKANMVYNAWLPAGGNYIETFIKSQGTAVGSSIGLLVNNLVLDYEMIKSNKIGIPTGKYSAGSPRPQDVEAYYSGISIELAVISAKNVLNVFQGIGTNGNQTGLDDYLNHINARFNGASLSSTIIERLEIVIRSLDKIPAPLSNSVRDNSINSTIINNTYTDIQNALVPLKSDMPSALGVIITYQDSDGD